MDTNTITQIYLTYLKRKPSQGDINAHIHKNKNDFIIEISTCPEYNNIISNQANIVSIVIPTRNRNHTLIRAVDSCINQTYKNLQIIICDDSDPNYTTTQDYYNKNYKIYPNITYIKNATNLGFCKNINQGLKIANGTYVALLFDDDYYYNTYIEKSVNIFKQNNNIGFVTTAAHNLFDGKLNTNTFHIDTQKYYGNMHKYYYYNGILNLYRENSKYIVWSVSPCNYIFRNNNILLRETLYPNFDQQQLKCGAGYDLLYILDNLKLYNYFYVNTEHLVCFDSTQGSFTIDNTQYVLNRMDITIKYWLEYEFTDDNILLKIQLLHEYNAIERSNAYCQQVINVDIPNRLFLDNIKKNNYFGL